MTGEINTILPPYKAHKNFSWASIAFGQRLLLE